jgi:hypothetical protein
MSRPNEQIQDLTPAGSARRLRRLGSVVLAAVLLGVPRALEARAFGAARSVYVEVADPAAGLTDFAEALSRALEQAGCAVAPRASGATVVVEVYALWRGDVPGPGARAAISFTAHDARGRRPLVLDYPAGADAEAARVLLRALDATG